MISQQIASIVIAVLLVGVGVLPILNRPKGFSERLFLAISTLLGIWVVANTFANVSEDEFSLFWTRLAYGVMALGVVIFRRFTDSFPQDRPSPWSAWRSIPIALIATLVSVSLLVAEEIRYIDGVSHVTLGPMYFVFLLHFFYFVGSALLSLWHSQRALTGSDRARAQLVLLAFGSTTAVGSVTNIIIPLLAENNGSALVGTYSVLLLIGITAFAMLKRKLFDIRAAITRTLAYTLTVGSIAVAYGLLAFLATLLLSEIETFTISERVIYIVFAILGAMAFPSAKKFFADATNKAFYRAAYDTQSVIDKISGLIVSEFRIDNLTQGALRLVSEAIKPEHSTVIVVDKNGDFYDGYTSSKSHKLSEFVTLTDLLWKTPSTIFDNADSASSSVSSGDGNSKVYKVMAQLDILLVVRLSTRDDTVGYLFFGPKLSGNQYTSQDLKMLSTASNELALAILNARRYDEIERFTVTLKLEVERATANLKRTNEKLKALDHAKDEFITMASHQLRTPLTSSKGYLSMVLEGDAGKITKKQADLIRAAFSSSQRMVFLVSDLLNISRLQTGKFLIEPVESYLPDVVEQEMKQLSETARVKGIKMTYHKPGRFPRVYVDETKLRQVMMNYIDNAIYYTPKGGKIELSLSQTAKSVEFRVKDSGIGVPKEAHKNLFTKFYRASNARKARPDGTGLGLFMAKKVIVDQGGAVIFESEEGKGSTFGFMFPLERVRPPKKKKKATKKKKTPVGAKKSKKRASKGSK